MAANGSAVTVKMASDGMWQGENPLDFALPLPALQVAVILVITQGLALALKPLHQPRVVAEILGGILLGPSALGRWGAFRRTLFPAWSAAALDTVSGLGLLLFLFLVGLELDVNSVRRVGPRSVAIAAAGIAPPFLAAAGLVPLLDVAVPAPRRASFLPLCVFVGAALSVTALPVLACILKELSLLGGGLAERAGEKVAPLVSGLMLPLYFATSGLHTDIDNVRGVAAWGMVALVVAVAIGGKFAGTFAVAAGTGMPRREAAALGVAMSAKGLVELIVLNIGKERKVLDDTTFAIFVIMALTTTVLATPFMTALYRRTPTATTPESDDVELKGGDACPA
uniref:Cation/H+ exchanger transmembrane domain-containing protein n=1 Tax=Oryza barthii TaxID=65489 RepID=A0A0D3G722_9ORYZ